MNARTVVAIAGVLVASSVTVAQGAPVKSASTDFDTMAPYFTTANTMKATTNAVVHAPRGTYVSFRSTLYARTDSLSLAAVDWTTASSRTWSMDGQGVSALLRANATVRARCTPSKYRWVWIAETYAETRNARNDALIARKHSTSVQVGWFCAPIKRP